MKKMTLFASLAIVLVAGSAFAFFNGEPKVEKPVLATQVYYHIGNIYEPRDTPPEGMDCLPDDYFCTVTLSGNNLPNGFSETSIPDSNANYTVAKEGANRSWQ